MDWAQLGVSGLIAAGVSALVSFLLKQKEVSLQRQRELREKRYLAILGLVMAKHNLGAHLPAIQRIRPELVHEAALDSELEAEFLNMFIYAGPKVMMEMGTFLKDPSAKGVSDLAIAMRKELWGSNISEQQAWKVILNFYDGSKPHVQPYRE